VTIKGMFGLALLQKIPPKKMKLTYS